MSEEIKEEIDDSYNLSLPKIYKQEMQVLIQETTKKVLRCARTQRVEVKELVKTISILTQEREGLRKF